jgi:hypothetical protein
MTNSKSNQIEATYLRYIYDGLSFNTLQKDNISALPEGLIGVYEEALSSDQYINTRERFLTFFAAKVAFLVFFGFDWKHNIHLNTDTCNATLGKGSNRFQSSFISKFLS